MPRPLIGRDRLLDHGMDQQGESHAQPDQGQPALVERQCVQRQQQAQGGVVLGRHPDSRRGLCGRDQEDGQWGLGPPASGR